MQHSSNVKITTLVLNAEGDPHFKSEDSINIENLIQISKKNEQNAREKGNEWTAGAISFFGTQLVNAVDSGESDDVSKAVIQMVMASWIHDSIFCGVQAKDYLESDIKYTVTHNGVVAMTRIPSPKN